MNNEIKEIIKYFKDDIDYLEEELKYPNFKGRYITIRDKECEYLRKLLDYITNLQQINKNLTNSVNNKVEEGIKLQLENGRLKNGINKILKLNEYMIHCESKEVIDKFLMKQWRTIYETLGIPEPGLARCPKNNLLKEGDK